MFQGIATVILHGWSYFHSVAVFFENECQYFHSVAQHFLLNLTNVTSFGTFGLLKFMIISGFCQLPRWYAAETVQLLVKHKEHPNVQ